MDNALGVIDQVVADLESVRDSGVVAGLSDAERVELLRRLGDAHRRVEALVVETVATADHDFGAAFGCRSTNELVQRALRTDAAGAARVVKASTLVRQEFALTSGAPLPGQWPALRHALRDGTIGVAGLLAATGPVEQAGPRIATEDRLRADAELAAYARGTMSADADADADAGGDAAPGPAPTPEDLRVLAQVIVAYLDPDGAEPEHERATRSRGVRLGRQKDGLIPLTGRLLPEVAGQLQRIWDAYLNPKVDGPPSPGVHFAPSEGESLTADGADGAGHERSADQMPVGITDTRSHIQLQHDALAAALGVAARHDDMPRLGGAAPTLVVSVSAEDYATGRGWAHVEGIDAPVPVSLARHTACGGTVQRVLFDPEGRIVGIGSSDRIFTVPQRRAITLRDRECLIPGCHVPASWCEIHHVTEHARGGPTSTDNGVALCWHHHRTLETSGWEIRMDDGLPSVRGPGWWDPTRRWWNPHAHRVRSRTHHKRSHTRQTA